MDLRDIRHFFEDLNLPRMWEQHSARIALGASAAVVLVLALVLLRCGGSGGARRATVNSEKYFFDLNTGKLVVGPAELYGPADLGGGVFTYAEGPFGSAVKAGVLSCNDCEGVAPGMTPAELRDVDASLAFLMRYPPAVLEVIIKRQTGDLLTPEEYRRFEEAELLYSTVEGKVWLPEWSDPASELVSQAYGKCGQRRAQLCAP